MIKFKEKKRKQNNSKKLLHVFQNHHLLVIEGSLDHNRQVFDLVLRNAIDGSEVHRQGNQKTEHHFLFEIDTSLLFQSLVSLEGVQLNWFLDVKTIEEEMLFIRLGRFVTTNVQQLRFFDCNENNLVSYVTPRGNLSLMFKGEPKANVSTHIERFSETKQKINVIGNLETKCYSIEKGEVILKGRVHDVELSFPVIFKCNDHVEKNNFGLKSYQYHFELDFTTFYLQEGVFDTYLRITWKENAEEYLVRIGNPRIKARYKLKESHSHHEHEKLVSVVTPYYTFKKLNLSFEVFELETDSFLYLQQQYKFSFIKFLIHKNEDIWLIGERPYKAQDTGYHFFKYMRENHPSMNVYYVIDEKSPELKNVELLGNVVFFKSTTHIKYALRATKVIGSHHPDYLFPIRTKKFKKKVKGIKVFLQHGVMGTKNMIANYGKKSLSFNTDAFIVSSEFEKEMIVTDFGYDNNEVFVTGLSRFDSLLKNDVEIKSQILIIPTWRDWISNTERFLNSEYYERYKELIYHPKLQQLSSQYGFSIVLCLHPNMQQFSSEFRELPIKVINQGEIDVQLLMKQSALLITDYSSVGFDFSFLHRPVIYYQFDRKRFIGNYPSHLDLDNDLPGDIVFDVNSLLQTLEYYCESQFVMRERNKIRSDKFLKYRDINASERIYDVISKLKRKIFSIKEVMNHKFVVDFFRKFRKSRYYFPLMKVMYHLLKMILPVDKNLILFESSLGKQYSDSPRYIYEEIVRRDLPYKKIWIYNENIRFRDEKTKTIERLSPQYYYYLARSGYWVNNQNFPTYISKRKKTIFLQTWHGTPLKKMLFDVENIQGRDKTYRTRIYKATQNWDYLISPNKYATEAFTSAFKFEKEILELGYPRNDIFYHSEKDIIYKQTRRKLNIPKDKKVILYAPTFRDNETEKNGFQFKLHLDLHHMKEKLGDEYILLLRLHIVIKGKFTINEELKEFVINASSYSEIQDLYLMSDILITDYSSVFFDFANTSKPILFFTYDFELYKNEVRGFYMNFEKEAPGPLLHTSEEVVNAIMNIEEIAKVYDEKYMVFKEKYCALEDGKASERVVDLIFEKN